MKSVEKITSNINKELKLSNGDTIVFIETAKRYIKAIKDRRVVCNIESVSASGMSRTLKFISCERNTYDKKHHYSNYYLMFKQLGFTPVRDSNYFRIHGCGMDMVFHTNYTIIHQLQRLGFISKKECETLAQETPDVI